MAAYASVISLKHTINRLLNSNYVSYTDPSRKDMESAYKELESLQGVLKRLDDSSISSRSSERVAVLDGQIRDAAYKLEDRLESRISNLFLQRSERLRVENRRLSEWISSRSSERVAVLDGQIRDAVHKLEDVIESRISNSFLPESIRCYSVENHPLSFFINEAINSFTEMKEKYVKELNHQLPEEDDAANSSITTDFGGNKSKMFGLSVEYSKLKDHLIGGGNFSYKVISLAGMAGIGKTTLVKNIFEDPTISDYFECRVWFTIGLKYQFKEIVQRIQDQVSPDRNEMRKKGDKELLFKRYLIVLDDVWDCKVWDDLAKLIPKVRNGSRVLVTTRLEKVSNYFSEAKTWWETEMSFKSQIQMRLLGQEESWGLFRQKMFGEESCPPQLEKAGKKIAENCDGLPLTIITVAKLLFKAEKTAEYWEKVAKRENSVFEEAYDQMSKVLLPSYHYLPQYLRACFLYMGVFPRNYEIPTTKLNNLWSAEGFLETNGWFKSFGYFAMECLRDLVSNNILMARQYSYDGRNIKCCSLHSVFWHLCVRVAWKNKFLHVLNSRRDGIEKSMDGQRRLCIHNNVLFGIKGVYNSMASISAAHSLLCTGQHHQYPVPLCLGLRLLRVLNAHTVRFYEFPVEVIHLVHLKYLALTYNGKLPASISQLWNLQFLIVRQHLSIKSPVDSYYLPVEVWNMRELEHLQVMGSDLPDPNGDSFLENLITLLDVSARSCTGGVLGKIRHLKKMGIQIELAHDPAELFSCFDNLSNLRSLESLKCFIVNPILMSEVVAPPPVLLSMLPSCLKKLSLSGFGFAWEEMSKIALLPKLKVLKLRCYAFRGLEWNAHKEKFSELEYLLIEDTDLMQWRSDYERCFPSLCCLVIRHCYKLKEIPPMYSNYELAMIEVVDSNPSLTTWAKQAREELKGSIEIYNLRDKFGDLESIFKVKEMAPN